MRLSAGSVFDYAAADLILPASLSFREAAQAWSISLCCSVLQLLLPPVRFVWGCGSLLQFALLLSEHSAPADSCSSELLESISPAADFYSWCQCFGLRIAHLLVALTSVCSSVHCVSAVRFPQPQEFSVSVLEFDLHPALLDVPRSQALVGEVVFFLEPLNQRLQFSGFLLYSYGGFFITHTRCSVKCA
jgi:hypothetical protein